MLPCVLGGLSPAQALPKAEALLGRVGLTERLRHKPGELSGGERQRVAIARALVNEPDCVLMDEPTGNLDQHTGEGVRALIEELRDQSGIAFIMVTHDMPWPGSGAGVAPGTGRLVRSLITGRAASALLRLWRQSMQIFAATGTGCRDRRGRPEVAMIRPGTAECRCPPGGGRSSAR